jgi:hypothetical protein
VRCAKQALWFFNLINYLLPSYGSFCEGSKQIHQSWVGIVSRTHKWLEKNYHNHQFTNPWIYHLHVKLTFNNSIHANKLTAWFPCCIKQTILYKTKSMMTNPSLIQKLEKKVIYHYLWSCTANSLTPKVLSMFTKTQNARVRTGNVSASCIVTITYYM